MWLQICCCLSLHVSPSALLSSLADEANSFSYGLSKAKTTILSELMYNKKRFMVNINDYDKIIRQRAAIFKSNYSDEYIMFSACIMLSSYVKVDIFKNVNSVPC